jgi:hypothetical protein
MELIELQNIWQQYDKNISKTMEINKEILRRMLISKPEKRLNWMKIKAGTSLIFPIVLILLILVPNVHYRATIEFFIGLFLFSAVQAIFSFWAIKYYLQIDKIDLSNAITTIKKDIKELEKYKFKISKLSYILIPFGIIGVFLLGQIPFFSKDSLLPFLLIILVMILSIYYTFKYSLFEQFNKLNMQIAEIEQLEKE